MTPTREDMRAALDRVMKINRAVYLAKFAALLYSFGVQRWSDLDAENRDTVLRIVKGWAS